MQHKVIRGAGRCRLRAVAGGWRRAGWSGKPGFAYPPSILQSLSTSTDLSIPTLEGRLAIKPRPGEPQLPLLVVALDRSDASSRHAWSNPGSLAALLQRSPPSVNYLFLSCSGLSSAGCWCMHAAWHARCEGVVRVPTTPCRSQPPAVLLLPCAPTCFGQLSACYCQKTCSPPMLDHNPLTLPMLSLPGQPTIALPT